MKLKKEIDLPPIPDDLTEKRFDEISDFITAKAKEYDRIAHNTKNPKKLSANAHHILELTQYCEAVFKKRKIQIEREGGV